MVGVAVPVPVKKDVVAGDGFCAALAPLAVFREFRHALIHVCESGRIADEGIIGLLRRSPREETGAPGGVLVPAGVFRVVADVPFGEISVSAVVALDLSPAVVLSGKRL